MRIRSLVVAITVSACGGGNQRPPAQPPPGDPWRSPAKPKVDGPAVVAKSRELTTAICACTSNNCIARTIYERNRWSQHMRSTYDMTSPGSYGPGEEAQAYALLAEFKRCAARTFPNDQTESTAADELIARRETLRDRMCACSTRACVLQVGQEVLKVNEEYGHVGLDETRMARFKALIDETMVCTFKAAARQPPRP